MIPDTSASWGAAFKLLSEGDDVERLVELVSPDMINARIGSRALLAYAIFKTRVACVRWLCDHGADISAVDGIFKMTPLHNAATHKGGLECMGVLLQHGAEVDALNVEMNTPLFEALLQWHVSCVRLLLYNGASLAKIPAYADVPPYAHDIVRGREQCRAACRTLLELRVAGRDATQIIARMLWTTRGMDVWQDAPRQESVTGAE